MEVEYWIYTECWKQVDYDTYKKFEGKKEHRPSTWRLCILNELLLPYRFL